MKQLNYEQKGGKYLDEGLQKRGTNGKKIPDSTIGLFCSNPDDWYFDGDKKILKDERVQLFKPDILRNLEDRGMLPKPAVASMAIKGRTQNLPNPSITFPFAVWELKSAKSGHNRQTAQMQNVRPIKSILDWQKETSSAAEMDWEPLAWHLISVGSEWSIFACHYQSKPSGSGIDEV